MFQNMGIANASPNVNLSWIGQATVQSAPNVTGAWTDTFSVTNSITNTFATPKTGSLQFFRLHFPPLP
jgi:hypothetical protein